MCRRICIYVVYDVQEHVDRYIDVILRELKKYTSKIIVVCNWFQNDKDYALEVDDVIYRENIGYDAGAYAYVINKYQELIKEYDELLLTNDTYYGPIFSFGEMFKKMQDTDCNYWGITRHPGGHCENIEISEHIQSYFLNFKSEIVHSDCFYEYWGALKNYSSIKDVIVNFEVGINTYLSEKGYRGLAYTDIQQMEIQMLEDDNPYLRYSKELIMDYRVPIIKRRSLDFDNNWFGNAVKALAFINDVTEYEVDLIVTHIKRLSTILSKNVKFNYYELDDFVKKHNKIYIYGNGKWARNMDVYLGLKGLESVPHIISEKGKDITVLSFSEISFEKGAGVIIAISNRASIREVYEMCVTKLQKEDILYPK